MPTPPTTEPSNPDPAKKPPSIAIGDTNPAIAIGDKNTSVVAPVVGEETELDAAPNGNEKKGDSKDEEDKLGSTWFDALLFAIRSGIKLSNNLLVKAITEWEKRQANEGYPNSKDLENLKTELGVAHEHLKELETELLAAHKEDPNKLSEDLKNKVERVTQTALTALDQIPENSDTLKESANELRGALKTIQQTLQPPAPGASWPALETAEEKAREGEESSINLTHAQATIDSLDKLATSGTTVSTPTLSSGPLIPQETAARDPVKNGVATTPTLSSVAPTTEDKKTSSPRPK